jgi:hypothetical protein
MLLAVYFAAMSVFNQKLDYYLVHILPLYIAILAIWVSWLWNRHSRLRSLITTAVIALIALQTGGIVLKARERSRLASERAAIDFLRAHTGPSAKIVGTAALIYDMNFDDRLKDDMYLGLKSGRTPDAIVIEPLYQDTYAGWELQRPEDMRRIRARLSEYKQVYSREDYNIYFRETSH